MPDDNNNQQNASGQNGQFAAYPPNRIEVHTLESDIEEFKKGGGQVDLSGSAAFSPQVGASVPAPKASEPGFSALKSIPPGETVPSFKFPGAESAAKSFSGTPPAPTVPSSFSSSPKESSVFGQEPIIPMKDIFESSADISEQGQALESIPIIPAEKKSWKIIAIIVGAIAIMAAGFSAYWFFLKDLGIFSPQPSVIETPTPEISPSPEVSPTPALISESHTSVFIKPADKMAEKVLNENKASALISLIIQEAQVPESENIFKEIVFRKDDGVSLVLFKDFISLMMPQINIIAAQLGTDTNELFENNFSFFLFYDPKVTQMGYAVKMKKDKYLAVANLMSEVEKEDIVAVLKNHFLIDAGEKIGSFKTGKIGPVETRYQPFQNAGLAFNYAFWREKDLFIVTTSRDAINQIILHMRAEE